MARKPETIDEYLSALSADKRAALTKLRKDIRRVVPKAEEGISYGIPAFRLDGRFFVGFGASARHCSFYPGALPIAAHKGELAAYDTSKGTIRFPANTALPASLVRKLIKARIVEYFGSRISRRRVNRRAT